MAEHDEPNETRRRMSDAQRRAWQSPTTRKRRSDGIRRAMTPARRAKIGRDRREYWRRWREAREAEESGGR